MCLSWWEGGAGEREKCGNSVETAASEVGRGVTAAQRVRIDTKEGKGKTRGRREISKKIKKNTSVLHYLRLVYGILW
jgi:hypothetical protein